MFCNALQSQAQYCFADTGIPEKQDYTKIQSFLMLVGFKFYGQSPENGAKSLVYASCAPEEDLRGMPHDHDSRTGDFVTQCLHPYGVRLGGSASLLLCAGSVW